MASTIRTGSVQFLHYADTGNVGDLLCSPRHYFDFTCDRPTLIVGGGASNNFFSGRARRQDARVRIAWGIGQSWTFGVKASPMDQLVKSAVRRLTYTRASTRDPGLVSDWLPLVPCVSVFHPVTELPVGTEVGIFLNESAKVSGAESTRRARDMADSDAPTFFATNGVPPEDFFRLFRRTGTLITNSYHAAYWGLLSGRSVHLIGYSSKFVSLAALFGFPESAVLKVERGDGAALDRAIAFCAVRSPLILANPSRTRSLFRQHNLEFAGGLSSVGVRCALKPADTPVLEPAA